MTETTFGKRLRELRCKSKLTQSALAEIGGFKPSAISHWELGRRTPSLANLTRLAKAMDVSVGDLVRE